MTQVIHRLSEMENCSYSPNVKEGIHKLYQEHMDGPVPECFLRQICQFKVLAIDDIVVKPKERDSCIRTDNKFVFVQNIIEEKGIIYTVGKLIQACRNL